MKDRFYRPLLWRLVCLAWLGLWIVNLGQVPVASGKVALKGDAYQVIALVNQVRASYGLPDLQAHSALMAAAQGHSDYQASIGTATHSGKGGSSPLQRAMAAGYGGGAKVYVSENIYSGNNASPSQAVNWWTGDGIHLQTMINPNATDAGAGVAQNGDTVFYTLLVGYVAGAPGSGPVSPSASGGTKAPTAMPFIPIVTSTPNPDGSIVHVVQPGQALWNIAAIYKVPLADLLVQNGLTENSFIYPGDKILIRKAEVTPTVEETNLPTPTLTRTATPNAPTATLIPLDLMAATLTPIAPQATETTLPIQGQVEQPSQSSAERSRDFFPLVIGGLFFVGGVLIILGTLARPHRG
jgi:LysM repeat protein